MFCWDFSENERASVSVCLNCRPNIRTVGTKEECFLLRHLLIFCSRTYNVHQVSSIVEDDSTFEPPPVNEGTDEDSGEEDGEGTFSSLNGQGQRRPLYEPELSIPIHGNSGVKVGIDTRTRSPWNRPHQNICSRSRDR